MDVTNGMGEDDVDEETYGENIDGDVEIELEEEDGQSLESDEEEIFGEDEVDAGRGSDLPTREPFSSGGSGEMHAAATELLQILFELCIAFMTEEFRDGQPSSSILVYYSGVLALQGTGEIFRTAKLFTPILSQLIYIQRLLFLEYALPYEAYPHIGLEE
ncbi:hypothetical protein DM02DRAFT_664634 [Periconia macrospinosa]|uniref:Uncharacterized protein n=1 Tax=Periconia macrospinosa TaxID=97972 RepID=A0A2V1CYL1_9PLEO|nr:hypothetical protein DM02DRAFT_664634 [Periconia macrospinosa]